MLPAQAGWRVWRGGAGCGGCGAVRQGGCVGGELGRETVGRTGIQYRAAGAGGGTSQEQVKKLTTKNNDPQKTTTKVPRKD